MGYRDGISCVIVNYKSLDNLKACIDSIRAQRDIEYEIIVVDNDSRDDTAEFLKGSAVKFIPLKENRGFGAAVNIGTRQAVFSYLFILNPDTIIPDGVLARLYAVAESERDFGLIAPALEYPDGRAQLSARSLPGRRDLLTGRGSPLYRLGITGEGDAGYFVPAGENPARIPAVSATAILVKRGLFSDLGGFDERFFMYMEDIDLCRRIREKGLPILMTPAIKIGHSWRGSSSKRPYFAAYHHHLSILKYFVKYDKNLPVMNLLLAIALAAGLAFTFAMIVLRRVLGR